MPPAPALVILRGNSASGKSSVARSIQRSLPRGRVAVIGQDQVRRDILREYDVDPVDTIALTELMVRHCLARGRIVILEGIFKRARYQQMFEGLLSEHDGPALVCYLDVSLPETLRRHALKPIAGHVSDEEVASWYVERDLLALPGELVLPEQLSEEDLAARILAELSALQAAPQPAGPGRRGALTSGARPGT